MANLFMLGSFLVLTWSYLWCSEVSGDREVQRTMLELLNQLDGFSSDDRIKVINSTFMISVTAKVTSSYFGKIITRVFVCQVIAATNRADILDPALMRSGRLDRKIEFPHPSEEARARILQVCICLLGKLV